ncbi:MAG: hypothetical protein QOG91_257 [Candidatus Parcubacteria bacterium]|nr:hypothetical protein [Candidatus Parcubacteria bacterium]
MLSAAWSLYKKHWRLLSGIAIVPSILFYFGHILFIWTLSPALSVISVLFSIVAMVGIVAMYPALVNAIHRLSTEAEPKLSLEEQYALGFKYFWSIVLLFIIQGLVFVGSFFAFIIPAIVIGMYVSTYIFARVLDDKKGFAALTEAYSLVRGRWWAVFGRLLYFVLVPIIGKLILGGAEFLIDGLFGLGSPFSLTLSPGAVTVNLILSFFFAAVLVPVALSYMYGLYMSLKATRRADVPTAAFKKWLTAFLVIGVIAIIAIPLVLGTLFMVQIKKFGSQKNWAEYKDMPFYRSPGGLGGYRPPGGQYPGNNPVTGTSTIRATDTPQQ